MKKGDPSLDLAGGPVISNPATLDFGVFSAPIVNERIRSKRAFSTPPRLTMPRTVIRARPPARLPNMSQPLAAAPAPVGGSYSTREKVTPGSLGTAMVALLLLLLTPAMRLAAGAGVGTWMPQAERLAADTVCQVPVPLPLVNRVTRR